MKLHLNKAKNIIVAELSGAFRGSPSERDAYWNDVNALSAKRGGVGFAFDKSGAETGTPCTWFCRVKQADKCVPLIDYCDDDVKALVQPVLDRINGSRATTGDFEAPAPEGLAYMPFQKAGIEYLVNSRDVLLADDMGLGKTIQVLGAINADKTVRKVLVVCPPSVRLNWKREAEKWLVGDWTIQVVNGDKMIDPRANFVICGWSNLSQKNVRPGLMNYSWDVAVWDEAHYGKNTRTAARAKIAFGYWDSEKRREVDGVAHRASRNYFLTGTPCPNRPKELYAMLRHLDPKGLGRGYKKYTRRYCGAYQGRWGWVDDGATNLDELQRVMRSKFMLRRMKSEVLTELPGKIRTVVRLDPADVKGASRILARQRKLLADAGISLEDINEGNAEEAIAELQGSPALFEEMSKLRAETGSLKIKHAAEFADQVLSGNKKVIVFAHHRDVQDQIAAALSAYGVVQVQGGMNDAAKQEAIDAFQNDDSIRVFVGSIQACREGITLTQATSVVFAELPWRPGDVDQAEDRANRIGQTQCVNSYYIVVDESLDAYIAETIAKKARNIDAALNSRKAEAPVDLGSHAEAKPKTAEKVNIQDLPRLPEAELAVAPF